MKGDFSRIRFSPTRHYTSVLDQQGRVSLDADTNEQRAIEEYLRCTQAIDVIGESGAPAANAGFRISLHEDGLHFSAGRYYVNGLLCETSGGEYSSQPYLIDPVYSDLGLLRDLIAGKLDAVCVQLEVWQRLVTALDDPCLIEPALGQADTTARLQTVWRVNTKPVLPKAGNPTVQVTTNTLKKASQQIVESRLLKIDSTVTTAGKLCVQLTNTDDDCSCDPIPAAGYRGLENQLYRVEIHQGGNQATATFKWSRENASVVSAIVGLSGSSGQKIFVDSLGRDANLGFAVNDWVEITDDSNLFGSIPNQPGTFHRIVNISGPGEAPSLTLDSAVTGIDPGRNARVRRWDQAGTATSGDIPVSVVASIDLENGIQVSFTRGEYASGDYWLITARTASGSIDWPPCGKGPQCQRPAHIPIYTVPLALITNDESILKVKAATHLTRVQKESTERFISLPDRCQIEDLRKFFSPLASSAIYVQEIDWRNDDLMTVDQLVAYGLHLQLDHEPTSQIDASIFRVSLEILNAKQEQALVANTSHSVLNASTTNSSSSRTIQTGLIREEFVLDGIVRVEDRVIHWNLVSASKNEMNERASPIINRLNSLLGNTDAADPTECARVRIRLLSSFVSTTNGVACGDAQTIYLDGQCFGRPAKRHNGSVSTALRLPSGNGAIASDFESWFFLAAAVQIDSLTFNPASVTVNPNARVATTTGTVELVTPSTTETQIDLSVTTVTGITFNFPATITIPAGEDSTTFSVTVDLAAGANPQNVIVEFSANADWKIGDGSGATGTFTINPAA